MQKYNPEIHHRRSVRIKNYDYSRRGLYCVTICTENRTNFFGEIIDEKMNLSNVGIIANVLWYEIPNHAQNVELHEFVIMPNHIHGILEFTDKTDNNYVLHNENKTAEAIVGAGYALPSMKNGEMAINRAEYALPLMKNGEMAINRAGHTLPLHPEMATMPKQRTGELPQSRFQNIGKNTLSSIIGSYKSAVTKHAHRLEFPFGWQRNLWEHIIRDYEDYNRITEYILSNPKNWEKDKFFGIN
ncbi:MAG: hypothetical protein LBN95_06355 [Prevotellaceae bacterium]|jgi:REP element-mobilizing transposase RayT|nr:hypothetical protein [Prevotellaceae bacterium]